MKAPVRTVRKIKRKKMLHPYICNKCAVVKFGGVWPRGHVATSHMDECPYCHITCGLVSINDYNYPRGVDDSCGAGRD